MNNIILVPTDFSEVCDNAMGQAAEAARALTYELVLLHVVDKNTRAELKKESKGMESIEEKLKARVGEVRAKYGIAASFKTVEGDIFTTIPEVAGKIGANLVFLGTHGKTGMQKLTGSYALKVVTASPVPTVVIQKRPFKIYREIVLPITSDAGPWEKTQWAAYIAKSFDASVHILHIGDEAVKQAVNIITDHLSKEKVRYSVKEASGSGFSRQVVDFATSLNADLIMIMTNPDKSFTSFLLGSYDEEMIFNASQIPVMCINPRKYSWEKIVKF